MGTVEVIKSTKKRLRRLIRIRKYLMKNRKTNQINNLSKNHRTWKQFRVPSWMIRLLTIKLNNKKERSQTKMRSLQLMQ